MIRGRAELWRCSVRLQGLVEDGLVLLGQAGGATVLEETRFELGDASVLEAAVGAGGLEAFVDGAVVRA
jgi:hypothetical protein